MAMWSVQLWVIASPGLLWRDIILLESHAVLTNFIQNLPANSESYALKNSHEQQGLHVFIWHDITYTYRELFSNTNNLFSFPMQYSMSRCSGHDHHNLLIYQKNCIHLFQPCRFQYAGIPPYWFSSSCSRIQFIQCIIRDEFHLYSPLIASCFSGS